MGSKRTNTFCTTPLSIHKKVKVKWPTCLKVKYPLHLVALFIDFALQLDNYQEAGGAYLRFPPGVPRRSRNQSQGGPRLHFGNWFEF